MSIFETAPYYNDGMKRTEAFLEKSELATHRGRLCNERAALAKEIEKLKLLHAAIDAGIQALEAQINAVVDNPSVP